MTREQPCKDCAERAVGCHAQCERYAEYRARLDEINRRRHEDRLLEYAHLDRMRKTIRRGEEYRRRKGK